MLQQDEERIGGTGFDERVGHPTPKDALGSEREPPEKPPATPSDEKDRLQRRGYPDESEVRENKNPGLETIADPKSVASNQYRTEQSPETAVLAARRVDFLSDEYEYYRENAEFPLLILGKRECDPSLPYRVRSVHKAMKPPRRVQSHRRRPRHR